MRRLGLLSLLVALLGGSVLAVGQPASAQDGGVVVKIYLLREGKIAAAKRTLAAGQVATPQNAVRALGTAVTPTELGAGLRTAIVPEMVEDATVSVDATTKVATVDLDLTVNPDRANVLPSQLAQIVYTVTQFREVEGVFFESNGESVPATLLDGSTVDEPATRATYESLTPAIFVESPDVADPVSASFRVRGTANTFEAEFRLQLFDSRDALLSEQGVLATSGSGERGTFNVRVPFTIDQSQRGTLVVFQIDAADGSARDIVAIPLLLIAPATPTPVPTSTPTTTPTATATATARSTIAPATSTPTSPPTATPTTQATSTPEPPTATATPKPPTATATPEPPTVTATAELDTPTSVPPPQAEGGVIALRVYNCPDGMQIETFDGSLCTLTMTAFDVRITARQTESPLPAPLTIANAHKSSDQFRWRDLPFGTYLFKMTTLPPGRDSYLVPRQSGAAGSAATGYTFSIDEQESTFELKVYTFTEGPVG